MLKDRRVLVERELNRARQDAATVYMDMIRSMPSYDSHRISATYQDLKDRIANLTIDLNIIDTLIEQGHE